MRAIFLDVENNECKIVDIVDDLNVYYNMLNCRIVEMPERRIGPFNRYFNTICDEEGLLKEDPKPSAVDDNGKPVLFGNLLITNVNDDGDVCGLSVEDCEYIVQFIQPSVIMNKKTKAISSRLLLTQCKSY